MCENKWTLVTRTVLQKCTGEHERVRVCLNRNINVFQRGDFVISRKAVDETINTGTVFRDVLNDPRGRTPVNIVFI